MSRRRLLLAVVACAVAVVAACVIGPKQDDPAATADRGHAPEGGAADAGSDAIDDATFTPEDTSSVDVGTGPAGMEAGDADVTKDAPDVASDAAIDGAETADAVDGDASDALDHDAKEGG